jgi:UDP-2,3-diacylglucosamine pyrophosphatase LpxH
MLIIVSDLHLTDGTTGTSISAGAFSLFQNRLEAMVENASERVDGGTQALKEVDVVLLGDILDIIRSTIWNQEAPGEYGYARPWHDLSGSMHAKKIKQIVTAILEENQESLAILRSLKDGKNFKTNIHYMVGNHDWYLHLPGVEYDEIRALVIAEMGLVGSDQPFAHRPEESAVLQELFDRHEVYAWHGDFYDPFNYDVNYGRDFPSLGDALVIDLFNPFPDQVELALGSAVHPDFYKNLRELGNIAPVTYTPVWIAGIMNKYRLDRTQREKVNAIWDYLTKSFLKSGYLDIADKKFALDYVDLIQSFLNFSRPLDIEDVSKFVLAFKEKLTDVGHPIYRDSMQEEAFKEKQARFIIYGHTHHHEVVGLEVVEKDGRPYEQLYINSGTWRPLYTLAEAQPGQMNFVSYKTMTISSFYTSSERKGRRFETWSGTLGLTAAEMGFRERAT